jgi:hypothetical protein
MAVNRKRWETWAEPVSAAMPCRLKGLAARFAAPHKLPHYRYPTDALFSSCSLEGTAARLELNTRFACFVAATGTVDVEPVLWLTLIGATAWGADGAHSSWDTPENPEMGPSRWAHRRDR